MAALDLWFCTLFSLALTNWISGMGRSPGPLCLLTVLEQFIIQRGEGKSPCDQAGPFSLSTQLLGEPNSLTLTSTQSPLLLQTQDRSHPPPPRPPPSLPPTLQHSITSLLQSPQSETPSHTCIPRYRSGWVGAWLGVGWGVNLLCSITRKAGEHNATASLWGRTSACPHHLLSLHPPSLRALHTSVSISLHGSDLTPRHASHPGVHHRQCVCGLQHPGRAPDWTGTGHLQTREVRVGPQGSRAQEKGKFRALKEETWNNCLFLESSCFYFAFSRFFLLYIFFINNGFIFKLIWKI